MNKKDYQTPTMKVVKLQHQCHIPAASPYEATGTSISAMDEQEDL